MQFVEACHTMSIWLQKLCFLTGKTHVHGFSSRRLVDAEYESLESNQTDEIDRTFLLSRH